MGMSFSAILFFGIVLDEEGLEEKIESLSSFEHKRMLEHVPQTRGTSKAWRDRASKWQEDQVTHSYNGSGDDRKPYLYINGSRKEAYWDEVVDIEVGMLDVGGSWVECLKDYCASNGLPWSEPKWQLVAYHSC